LKSAQDEQLHPEYKKPELLATAPNEVWSWDVTKLLGPVKWTYFGCQKLRLTAYYP